MKNNYFSGGVCVWCKKGVVFCINIECSEEIMAIYMIEGPLGKICNLIVECPNNEN